MRIRSILPDFYRSEDVAALDWHHRLVFIGLWSYADDNGVGRDVVKLIAADLFPLDGDPMESLRRVSTALDALAAGGQIARYTADGVAYLFVVKWDKYQRVQNPGKERYPRPTCENADPTETLRTPSGESPETLSLGEGEKGRRGEGEKGETAETEQVDPPRFDVLRLCDILVNRIEGNGSKRPTVTKAWRDAARLMLDRDGRTVDEVVKVIDWCQADEFWRGNILSMPKLREKFDQLRLQASRARSTADNRVTQVQALKTGGLL